MEKEKVKESWGIKMEGSMKENGNMIWDRAEALKNILMVTLFMVSIKWEKQKEKVYINGIMEKFMMVSGIMDWSMVMEFGKV